MSGSTNIGFHDGAGIIVSSSERVSIAHNDVADNAGLGIYDTSHPSSDGTVIANNTVTNNGGGGIQWTDGGLVTITGNEVSGNGGSYAIWQ